MSARIRKPLFQAEKPANAATVHPENPATLLETHYRHVWETSMHDMPFVNPALSVTAIGFHRHEGDWVGALVTPWFLNLFILPGGGKLWTDHASGDRVRVTFPVGELEFIADYDPDGILRASQYCPLFAPVSQFASQEIAVAAAEAALSALFSVPEPEPTPVQHPAGHTEDHSIPARRAFFRRVAGQKT